MSEEFHSPTEPEPPPFWLNKPSVFTPEYLDYLWDTYRVSASLPGGFFVSGNYELAKHFPRFRRTLWREETLVEEPFGLEQEIAND